MIVFRGWPCSATGSGSRSSSTLRRRFHAVVDTAGLSEDRARDWVVVRMMLNALDAVMHPDAGYPDDWMTTCIAVAKAVQD